MKAKEDFEFEEKLLPLWTQDRIENLKNQFLSNDVNIDKTMFRIIKKKGDFKEKEKQDFDKKFILRNGEVYRRSDNSMMAWFDLSSIIYQRDLIYFFCLVAGEEKEIRKNVWQALNYWNEK
jgi:hypothetical protein